jgi:hypothetical protein
VTTLGGFREIAAGCAIGDPLPPGWRRLRDCDLLIVCGVTGVGKTSALAALGRMVDGLASLPERRTLFDAVVARHYGADPAALDRIGRFALTDRFRQDHHGGMAAILEQLAVRQEHAAAPLLFDGLRGEDEIRHADRALPLASFAALLAPDFVRLRRLLGRGDAFDRVASPPAVAPQSPLPGGLDAMFTPVEIAALAEQVAAGSLPAAELAAKLAIVREERLHYDPDRMLAALGRLDPARWLAIDTTRHDPREVAALVAGFLRTDPRPPQARADASRR